MYKKIVIGVDQSYKRTGITVIADGDIKSVGSVDFENCKNNSEKRRELTSRLDGLIGRMVQRTEKLIVIIERIRLRSEGFLNINYIKSIGALNAIIIDVAQLYGVEVYSVDTRSWKSQIIGTSKPMENNKGIDPKKYPTVKYVLNLLRNKPEMRDKVVVRLPEKTRKSKGVYITPSGEKVQFNDDLCDSVGIASYGFLPESRQQLELEK